MQTFQMHLSQKQKIFPHFFSPIFDSALNFERLQKKMTLIANVFPKFASTEDELREMPKRSRLRGPQERRHGKRAQALIQY